MLRPQTLLPDPTTFPLQPWLLAKGWQQSPLDVSGRRAQVWTCLALCLTLTHSCHPEGFLSTWILSLQTPRLSLLRSLIVVSVTGLPLCRVGGFKSTESPVVLFLLLVMLPPESGSSDHKSPRAVQTTWLTGGKLPGLPSQLQPFESFKGDLHVQILAQTNGFPEATQQEVGPPPHPSHQPEPSAGHPSPCKVRAALC